MADITKFNIVLNTGVPVSIAAADGSAISITDTATDLAIVNGADTIASFSKNAVAYWTTDLINA